MTARRHSVAITGPINDVLIDHLLRDDGQEDVCLATYQLSTGATRDTAILTEVMLPHSGERQVHGNATFTGAYVRRVVAHAATTGRGVAILHSHPLGRSWQHMSPADADAEAAYAAFVTELTGHPLVGLTLAGLTRRLSARWWAADKTVTHSETVRVLGERFRISRNPTLMPPVEPQDSQVATIDAWGSEVQQQIAGLKILVIGAGSVGLDLLQRLAATGVHDLSAMDPDVVEKRNLDRLIGATPDDVDKPKVDLADRLLAVTATAKGFTFAGHQLSITTPEGIATALDADLMFCATDHRPWARSALNTIAYTDLIPVIDGGVDIAVHRDGTLRNATWRSHVLRPGRPCMACNGQLELGDIELDRQGLLEDRAYIEGAGRSLPGRQNVTVFAMSATAQMLTQFVTLMANPSGMPDPGPLRSSLNTHMTGHLGLASRPHCPIKALALAGDTRPHLL